MAALGVEWVRRQPDSFRVIASELSELESTSEPQRSEKASPATAEVGKWQEEAELRFRMEDRTVRWIWKGQFSRNC